MPSPSGVLSMEVAVEENKKSVSQRIFGRKKAVPPPLDLSSVLRERMLREAVKGEKTRQKGIGGQAPLPLSCPGSVKSTPTATRSRPVSPSPSSLRQSQHKQQQSCPGSPRHTPKPPSQPQPLALRPSPRTLRKSSSESPHHRSSAFHVAVPSPLGSPRRATPGSAFPGPSPAGDIVGVPRWQPSNGPPVLRHGGSQRSPSRLRRSTGWSDVDSSQQQQQEQEQQQQQQLQLQQLQQLQQEQQQHQSQQRLKADLSQSGMHSPGRHRLALAKLNVHSLPSSTLCPRSSSPRMRLAAIATTTAATTAATAAAATAAAAAAAEAGNKQNLGVLRMRSEGNYQSDMGITFLPARIQVSSEPSESETLGLSLLPMASVIVPSPHCQTSQADPDSCSASPSASNYQGSPNELSYQKRGEAAMLSPSPQQLSPQSGGSLPHQASDFRCYNAQYNVQYNGAWGTSEASSPSPLSPFGFELSPSSANEPHTPRHAGGTPVAHQWAKEFRRCISTTYYCVPASPGTPMAFSPQAAGQGAEGDGTGWQEAAQLQAHHAQMVSSNSVDAFSGSSSCRRDGSITQPPQFLLKRQGQRKQSNLSPGPVVSSQLSSPCIQSPLASPRHAGGSPGFAQVAPWQISAQLDAYVPEASLGFDTQQKQQQVQQQHQQQQQMPKQQQQLEQPQHLQQEQAKAVQQRRQGWGEKGLLVGVAEKMKKKFRMVLLAECYDVQEFYSLGQVIGEGQFGTIRKVEHRRTGERFACKSISKSILKMKSDIDDIRNEHKILKMLEAQPHVCHLVETFEDAKSIHFVMELCEGGDLFDRLKKKKTYAEPEAAKVLQTILRVLHDCHKKGIVHRDIKPENVLLCSQDSHTNVKVIDFGIATLLNPDESPLKEVVGSLLYIAPEVLDGEYSCPADVWSAGVLLYVLLTGSPPFWSKSEAGLIQAIQAGKFKFSKSRPMSDGARHLILQMLRRDPETRVTAEEALSHPWIISASHMHDQFVNHGKASS